MTETRFDPPPPDAPGDRWGRDSAGSRPAGPESVLQRFLGGTPMAVFLRLLFVSAIVGAALMWLRIRPIDILLNIEDLINRLWSLGFDAIREIGDYIVAGALIVVPIWLVVRLLNFRGGR
jgi:hypothetical protein